MPRLVNRMGKSILKIIAMTRFRWPYCSALVACLLSMCLEDRLHVACAIPTSMSQPKFEDGVKLYNQKQFKQALPIFIGFLKTNPRSPSSYLYIANCYYGLNQIELAKQTYQILITSFPNSSEALTAREFVTRLQAHSESAGDSVAKSKTEKSDTLLKKAVTKSSVSDRPVGDLNVRIIRPLQDHPVVSLSVITAVREQIRKYPKSVKKMLYENHIEVVLTPTLIDKNPEMKNQEGRGYDGYTLKSCPGMFQDGRSIVICERTMDEYTESVHDPIPTERILATLNHECGHAIDSCLGDLSESDEFKHVYLLDAAAAQRLDASVSRDLAYYLQKSEAGQQECCGELLGIILGTDNDRSEKMKTAFPQTINFLKLKLGIR